MFFRQRLIPILYRVARALGIDLYKINGVSPPVVADFAGEKNGGVEYYRVRNRETTFDNMFTYTGASNKTMTDSDGNLKWAPHNTALRSTTLDHSSWTYLSSATVTGGFSDPDGGSNAYEVEASSTITSSAAIGQNAPGILNGGSICFWAKSGTTDIAGATVANGGGPWAWFDLANGDVDFSAGCTASIVSVGDGWYFCRLDVTLASPNNRLFILGKNTSSNADPWTADTPTTGDNIYVYGVHVFRSDLGGMVDNPDRGDSYVPTTTTAVYLPRRNSYRYNGDYFKTGITLESAAATNLVTYSQDFDDTSTSYWTNTNTTALSADATGPDGQTSATTIQDDSGTGTGTVEVVTGSITVSISTAYTASVYAKADGLSWLALGTQNFTTPGDVYSYFDLSTGSTGTAGAGHSLLIEDVGNGWYRCAITFTTDGTDTTGNIAIGVADADTDNTVDRDGTSSILAYGAMFEAGSVPTSLVVTSGATATRAAETLTIAAADMAYSSSAMSFQMQGEVNYADDDNPISTAEGRGTVQLYLWDPGGNGHLEALIITNSTNVGTFRVTQRDDSGTHDFVNSSSDVWSPDVNVSYNISTRHTSGALNGAYQGTAMTENSTPTALTDASTTSFELACGGITSTYTGTIALFRQADTDWGDTGIEAATQSPYYIAASNSEPKTVADFAGELSPTGIEYYRKGGINTTFDGMFTYTGASNKTMTDSDGNLKWAPHNFVENTEGIGGTSWVSNNTTEIENDTVAPDGTTTASKVYPASTGTDRLVYNGGPTSINGFNPVNGYEGTWGCFIKAGEFTVAYLTYVGGNDAVKNFFNLSTGAVTEGSTAVSGSASMTDVGNGWWLCKFSVPGGTNAAYFEVGMADAMGDSTATANGTDGIYVWGAHCYTSALGGMVNNPDRGDSYVPNASTTTAVFLPRRNSYRYTGASYEKKGITLESAAATNLVTDSQDFSAWTQSDVGAFTLTANDSTGPDGLTSMTKMEITDTTNERHRLFLTQTISASTTYTQSLYVKPNNLRYISLRLYGGGLHWVVVVYDLQSLIVSDIQTGSGSGTHVNSGIEPIGNGIYRIHMTGNVDTVSASSFLIQSHSSGTPTLGASNGDESYAGTAGEYIHIYGAQTELGSVPTSLIPTSGATATRAAETLTIAAADMAASTSAMSFHMQGEVNYTDNATLQNSADFFGWGATTGNRIYVTMDTRTTDTGAPLALQAITSTADFSEEATPGSYSPGVNVAWNIASRHTSGAIQIAVEGSAATADTTPTALVDLSAQIFRFASDGPGNGTTYTGTYALFRQDDSDWGDTGIEEASTE